MANPNQAQSTANPQPYEGGEGQSSKPPKSSIRERLNELLKLVQAGPESDATKKLKDDLDTLTKEYSGLTDVVGKYETAYKEFLNLKHQAEAHVEQMGKWTEKIKDEVKKPIDKLWDDSKTEHDKLKKEKEDSETALDSLKGAYDQAAAEESREAAIFQERKKFEDKAKSYFTDLTALQREADTYQKAGKERPLYAVYVVAKDLFQKIEDLDDPTQFKTALDGSLRTLIDAKEKRFKAHKELLEKQEAAKNTKTNYDSFVEGRRKAFVRDAQDV